MIYLFGETEACLRQPTIYGLFRCELVRVFSAGYQKRIFLEYILHVPTLFLYSVFYGFCVSARFYDAVDLFLIKIDAMIRVVLFRYV